MMNKASAEQINTKIPDRTTSILEEKIHKTRSKQKDDKYLQALAEREKKQVSVVLLHWYVTVNDRIDTRAKNQHFRGR